MLAAMTVMTIALSACGGGSSSDSQQSTTLSGNWKFTVSAPSDNSFSGGLQGGFLLQNNGSVSGAAVYSVSAPALPAAQNPCNSGSAPITGTISNLNVTLTAVAGSQTFTFTGALSSDGSTMNGTYASTAGTAADVPHPAEPLSPACNGLQVSSRPSRAQSREAFTAPAETLALPIRIFWSPGL